MDVQKLVQQKEKELLAQRLKDVRNQENQIAKQKTQQYVQQQKMDEDYKLKLKQLEDYQEKLKLIENLKRQKDMIVQSIGQAQKDAQIQMELKASQQRLDQEFIKIQEDNRKLRAKSAKQWIIQQEKINMKEKELVERKKQVFQEEQRIAHEMAQKYREEFDQKNNLEEYDHFQKKKGKKIDIQLFQNINSRIVKHDFNHQNSNAMEIAILAEEQRYQSQIEKKQKINRLNSSNKSKNDISKNKIKEQEILNQDNKLKLAECIFEKQFLKNNSYLKNDQNLETVQKKEMLLKRKEYGNKIKNEAKTNLKQKNNKQLNEKNVQFQNDKISNKKNNQSKNSSLTLSINQNKITQNQIEIKNQYLDSSQEISDYDLDLSSSSEEIQNQQFTNNFQNFSGKNEQQFNNDNLQDYIEEQEKFLSKIEQDRNKLNVKSIQDHILDGNFEIKSNNSNSLIDQFMKPKQNSYENIFDQNSQKNLQNSQKNLQNDKKNDFQNSQNILQNGQNNDQNNQKNFKNGQKNVQNNIQNDQKNVQNCQQNVQNGQKNIQNDQKNVQNGQKNVNNQQDHQVKKQLQENENKKKLQQLFQEDSQNQQKQQQQQQKNQQIVETQVQRKFSKDQVFQHKKIESIESSSISQDESLNSIDSINQKFNIIKQEFNLTKNKSFRQSKELEDSQTIQKPKIEKTGVQNQEISDKPEKTLAELFLEKKRNLAEKLQSQPKREKVEKTKEELIQYRKDIMKKQTSVKKVEVEVEIEKIQKNKNELLMSRLASGQKQQINSKDMKELTQKNFNLLPEQKKKKLEKDKKQEARDRREKMKQLGDKVRQNLLNK